MDNNILLHWNKKELIQQKQELVDAINALEDEISNDIIQRMKDAIKELEDKILETDGERYFLVDKNDENIIIIDFWKEFESEEVEVLSDDNFHLIAVRIFDAEDNECYKIIDFNGVTIVEFCREFSIIGNHLKVIKSGYMLDFHYDDRNKAYWSIVD